MWELKKDTAIDWPFFAFDLLGDGVIGLSDNDFTKQILKATGDFHELTAEITEKGFGFYNLLLLAAHTNVLGPLTIVLLAGGIKQVNLQFKVQLMILDDFAPPAVSLEDPCAQNPALTRGPTTEPGLPLPYSKTLLTTNNH